MSTIGEDVKSGQFKNIYLLCGSESYQRERYRDVLKGALGKDLDSMNINCYEGKDISIPALIDVAETMPFFAERRVILIENSGLFGSAGEKLAEYLENPSPTTYFIFVEEDVDKRSKLYKTCNAKGKVEVCEILKPDELKTWVVRLLARDQKQMTGTAYTLFLDKTGSNMTNMRTELEKLVCYVGERSGITEEDVEAICYTRVNSKVFDLVDAIARKQQKKALDIYGDMLALKEPAMRILFLIARQFNLLLMAKQLKQKGMARGAMASKMGVQDFVVKKCLDQATGFSTEILKKAVNDCVSIEEDVKKGRMIDTLAVEMIIVGLSHA